MGVLQQLMVKFCWTKIPKGCDLVTVELRYFDNEGNCKSSKLLTEFFRPKCEEAQGMYEFERVS